MNIVLRFANLHLVFYDIENPTFTNVSCLIRSSETPVTSKIVFRSIYHPDQEKLSELETATKSSSTEYQCEHCSKVCISSLTSLTNVSFVIRSSATPIPFNIILQRSTHRHLALCFPLTSLTWNHLIPALRNTCASGVEGHSQNIIFLSIIGFTNRFPMNVNSVERFHSTQLPQDAHQEVSLSITCSEEEEEESALVVVVAGGPG